MTFRAFVELAVPAFVGGFGAVVLAGLIRQIWRLW